MIKGKRPSNVGRFIICKQCSKKVVAHAWNQVFCCHECGMIFYEIGQKNKHVAKHGKKEKIECEICGYNKYCRCLEWHHVFSDEKEFNLIDWAKHTSEENEAEYEKCVLLCCNCHNEIHRGLSETMGKAVTIIENRRKQLRSEIFTER